MTAKAKKRAKKRWQPSGLAFNVRLKLFIRRNRVLLRAGGVFFFCILVSVLVYPKFLGSDAFDGLKAFTARATGFFLNLFRTPAEVNGTIVSSSDFSINIVGECTGVVPMIIFLSAVLAYPGKIKQKLVGMAIGIAGLYLLNLVRTVSLFYIGSAFPDFFESAHFIAWQALMILFAIVLWLFWVEKLVHVISQ